MKIIEKIKQHRAERKQKREQERKDYELAWEYLSEMEKKAKEQKRQDEELERKLKQTMLTYFTLKLGEMAQKYE